LFKNLSRTPGFAGMKKTNAAMAGRGIPYAVIHIMFFIIIAGALTLSSAVTLAVLALKAPEAYETEHGLQVVHRIPKRRASAELSEALVQAR
jgi:hypothetical protein